jgi:hypothetical protein
MTAARPRLDLSKDDKKAVLRDPMLCYNPGYGSGMNLSRILDPVPGAVFSEIFLKHIYETLIVETSLAPETTRTKKRLV